MSPMPPMPRCSVPRSRPDQAIGPRAPFPGRLLARQDQATGTRAPQPGRAPVAVGRIGPVRRPGEAGSFLWLRLILEAFEVLHHPNACILHRRERSRQGACCPRQGEQGCMFDYRRRRAALAGDNCSSVRLRQEERSPEHVGMGDLAE